MAVLVGAHQHLPPGDDLFDGQSFKAMMGLIDGAVEACGSLRDSALATRFLKNAIRIAPDNKIDPVARPLLLELVEDALHNTAKEYAEAGFMVGVAAGLRGFGRKVFEKPKPEGAR
jgi:hypothetical protein